ncbi:MAG: hypothetical protein ACLRWP_20450 [Bilophila wadsworthia]
MQQRYNAIIIGFGKGGKTLAAYLADQGQSVAIVERSDKMYGGTCINIACIPARRWSTKRIKSLCRGGAALRKGRRLSARHRPQNEVTGFLRGKNTPCLPTGTMWTSSRGRPRSFPRMKSKSKRRTKPCSLRRTHLHQHRRRNRHPAH